MQYELKGVTTEGRVDLIDITAPDEHAARGQAAALGYAVLSLRPKQALLSLFQGQRERFPVLLFSQELLVLLKAGLPLVSAIDTLGEKERHGYSRAILQGIANTLREGRPLSSALEQQPSLFSPLFIATVRASERTSDLAPALSRYVAYQHQVEAVRKRLVNASIYPALLILTGGLVSLFLLLYVVPRFGKIYEERATDLPWLSQFLLQWGNAVQGHTALVVGLMLAACVAMWYVSRLPAVRGALSALCWRLPAIGDKIKVYQLARFYRTIGMLLRGGTPLVSALGMGEQLLHPVLRGRLAGASRDIREGQPVSASMERHGLTTPVALRMLSVGEEGGNMGDMMDSIALFHDEELARWVDWFTRLFEPLLMAFIGLIIGSIVILMYMPIFELAGSMR